MPKPRLGIIFLIVLIDIIGFSLLLPILPYYAAALGATPTQIGLLTGLYALCQFVGAPVLARLSDRVGRKPMFLLDITGSIIGFVLLGCANALWMLFLARFVAGLVAANVPIAQAYIADVTLPEDRSKSLGLIGAAFGLGFTIGPALGGILTHSGNYAVPAFVSAALGMVNILVIAFALPESIQTSSQLHFRLLRHTENREEEHNGISPSAQRRLASTAAPRFGLLHLLNIHDVQRLFSLPGVVMILLVWVVFSFAFALFQQNITLFNKLHLHLNARESSYVFAYIGVLVAMMQGIILRPLTARYSDIQLLRASIPLMAISLALWAFAPSTTVLLIAIAPLSFAASTLITVINSLLTKAVPSSDVGGIMGFSGAVDNSTRFITAFAGGMLMEHIGAFAPGAIATSLMLGLFAWSSLNKHVLQEHDQTRQKRTIPVHANSLQQAE